MKEINDWINQHPNQQISLTQKYLRLQPSLNYLRGISEKFKKSNSGGLENGKNCKEGENKVHTRSIVVRSQKRKK